MRGCCVGDKLVAGEVSQTSDGRVLDLRNIRSPVVVFCSEGDDVRLALGLDVDVEMLFNEKATSMQAGRRSVTRAGEGVVVRANNYSYEMLSTDIAHKKFVPIVATLLPSRPRTPRSSCATSGEEFVYVLSGHITILTSLYTPLQLDPGDSCYFDSAMGRVLVAANGGMATVLWVASVEPNLSPQPA